MFIKSIILEGFKSYGKRTEINGFDPEFNAITGLNGTGKSNILDSICFVLGISNLVQVRATSLQDLVYKSGQAGITKATVTISFDNSDKSQCPLGYERCDEISITRQIVVGGKNKYLINGKSVQNKKVQDLFCSVQLNVNNPNFLIMQGRITKVLNMKPSEFLSMIEEAAGTSMYESKREHSMKQIDKREAKLSELNSLLKEEIEPKLEKLREERSHFLEYQKVCRDIEHYTRVSISFKYTQLKNSTAKFEEIFKDLTNKKLENETTIHKNIETIENIDLEIGQLQKTLEGNKEIIELEKKLSGLSTEDAKVTGKINAIKDDMQVEERKLKQLEKSKANEAKDMEKNQKELQNIEQAAGDLKAAYEKSKLALETAQATFEALSTGVASTTDGSESLKTELSNANEQCLKYSTLVKQLEMKLQHTLKLLETKKKQTVVKDSSHNRQMTEIKNYENDILQLDSKLKKIGYVEGTLETIKSQKFTINNKLRGLRNDYEQRNGLRYEFTFTDPEPNFDHRRVKGMVCNLITVKQPMFFKGLSMAAGGSLFNVVTDSEATGKLLLQRGNLRYRVTIIPLNKVNGRTLDASRIQMAQQVGGQNNVWHALSLLDYEKSLHPAISYIYGSILICKNLEVAKKVAFHPQVMCKCVTLDGDVVSPDGTLAGGAAPKEAPILLEVDELKKIKNEQNSLTNELNILNSEEMRNIELSNEFKKIKDKLDYQQKELDAARARFQNTSFSVQQHEIEELEESAERYRNEIATSMKEENNYKIKKKEIESKLANSKDNIDNDLKLSESKRNQLKKEYEKNFEKWKQYEQKYETIRLSIEKNLKNISEDDSKITQTNEELANLMHKIDELQSESEAIKEKINSIEAQLKDEKNKINKKSEAIISKQQEKEKLIKKNQALEIEIKKCGSEISKSKNDIKAVADKKQSLEEKYHWIKEDQQYFGVKNTRYDYTRENPVDADKRLKTLIGTKEKMSRTVNEKAMALLEKEEEMFQDVVKRMKTVEDDKKKLIKMVLKLDENKKRELKKAWQEVNSNLNAIFSTILPGAEAKLIPFDGSDFLKGLEVKVGFNGLWKDSLSELSGGQRSLVALSIILAMLKYKPAPLYILDEVDAALDLSHTQNIGNMLKHHFKNSQFIIVSLKDGMFNNANVLFRTKFIDGMSGIIRNTNKK